jgi:hypothetical protein
MAAEGSRSVAQLERELNITPGLILQVAAALSRDG